MLRINSQNNICQTQLPVRCSPKRRRNVLGSDEDNVGEIYSYMIQRSKNAKIVSTSKHGRTEKFDHASINYTNLQSSNKSNNYYINSPLTDLDINANNSPKQDHKGPKHDLTRLKHASNNNDTLALLRHPSTVPRPAHIRPVPNGIRTSPCLYRSDRFFRPIQSPSVADTPSSSIKTVQPSPDYSMPSPLPSYHPSYTRSPPPRHRFIPAENHHRSRKFYRRFLSLNKFWHGTLYRKQTRDDGDFAIHINPIPDPYSGLEFDVDYNITGKFVLRERVFLHN